LSTAKGQSFLPAGDSTGYGVQFYDLFNNDGDSQLFWTGVAHGQYGRQKVGTLPLELLF